MEGPSLVANYTEGHRQVANTINAELFDVNTTTTTNDEDAAKSKVAPAPLKYGATGFTLPAEGEAKNAKAKKLKKEKKPPEPKVGYLELLRFATALDWLLICIGVIAACGCGACMPLVLVLFAGSIESAGQASNGAFDQDELTRQAVLLVVVGVALWFGTGIYMGATDIAKVRMMACYKKEYVKSIIRQDLSWFDTNNPSELAPGIGAAMSTIEDGLGNKVMQLFENSGTGLGCLGIAFYYNPWVSFVVVATFPVVMGAAGLMNHVQQNSTKNIQAAYAEAGGRANEALSSMRTIACFSLEERTAKLYESGLKRAEVAAVWAAVLGGFALSVFMASMNLMFGAGLLFGGLLLAEEHRSTSFEYSTVTESGEVANYCAVDCGNPYSQYDLVPSTFNVSCVDATYEGRDNFVAYRMTCASASLVSDTPELLDLFGASSASEFESTVEGLGSTTECSWPWIASSVLLALLSVQTGAQQLGLIGQNISPIVKARQAAVKVLRTIERMPTIDAFSTEGNTLTQVRGEIEVKDVYFAYPSAPDVQVCNGYSLHVPAGQVVALCGQSGSGKSTIINLVERFYDPHRGAVHFDGVDVRTLNVSWLRQQIGLVGQEPVLFVGTVAENIAYGKKDGATQEEIEAAAEMANAHGFIKDKLPDGYGTQVGQGGSKLSGGQKQRVAIARALVRKPSIMLLDEATSALDTASERVVQKALDSLMAKRKRTTITIAHRLSTIRNADKIAVVHKGQVVESGTYDKLLAIGQGGRFYELAQKQEEENEGRKRKQALLGEEGSAIHGSTYGSSLSDESMSLDGTAHGRAEKVTTMKRLDEENGDAAERRSDKAAARAVVDDDDTVVTKDTNGKKKRDTSFFGVLKRLNKLQAKGDSRYLIAGAFLSMIDGCINPAIGFIFVKLLTVLYEPNPDDIAKGSVIYGCVYIIIGVVAVAVITAETACLGIPGQHLTTNLRSLCMRTFLKQDMGYFDAESNSAGELTSFLEEKVTLVQAMNGEKIGTLLRTIFTLVSGLGLVFYFGYWQLSLVMLASVPIIALAMSVQMMVQLGATKQGAEKSGAKEEKSAGSFIGEVVIGIRTVSSFSAEQTFFNMYCEKVDEMSGKGKVNALVGGLAAGLAKGVPLMVFGVVFYYGGTLLNEDIVGLQTRCADARNAYDAASCGYDAATGTSSQSPECAELEAEYYDACDLDSDFCSTANTDFLLKFMVPSLVVFFMAMGIGMASSTATDASKAKEALLALFDRLERQSAIDPSSTEGARPASCAGDIQLQDVVFAYPTRLDYTICNGYTLHVPSGQVVALCGPSGSGKSTIIALVERFYDPQEGSVMLDGVDVRTLNVSWLRQQIGLVGQEPMLFVGTVAENIAYGKVEGCTQQEIEEAATKANAHSFIVENLPQQYQTQVGIRGGKLSGGQKQRVAIARALVRKPSIMLLDEATSALDNESERIVQAALDEIIKEQKKLTGRGRTTITIAHRLTTIRNSDKIAVVHRGQVLEEGTHNALMEKHGVYFELVEAQR